MTDHPLPLNLPPLHLPRLHPRLKYFKGNPDPLSGEPTLTLYDPLQNKYFKLSWAESEVIARSSLYNTIEEVMASLEKETTVKITPEEIRQLTDDLDQKGLTITFRTIRQQSAPPLWKKLLHGYLSFSIALCHPQHVLERTYPFIAGLFSTQTTRIMAGLLCVMGLWTLTRGQEFSSSIPGQLDTGLVIRMGIIFALIKLAHELAHAYTAIKHKIPVPHMGVTFIVFFPVLYTETSAAWRLTDKKDRLDIALAGIRIELVIATLALVVWNMSTIGSPVHMLSFLVVAVSLVSSLVVNLNPLMRFDGYYILSDLLGIENLQFRACTAFRQRLRESLFGITQPPEEDGTTAEHRRLTRFLTIFGAALISYRFILYTGIAYLVYTHIAQPFGTILAMIELWFFILMPVLGEVSIWRSRKTEILSTKRTKITLAIATAIFIAISAPIHSVITIPAIAELADTRTLYPPVAAEIIDIKIETGLEVSAGDELIILKSPALEYELEMARQIFKQKQLAKRVSRIRSNAEQLSSPDIVDEELQALAKKIAGLEGRKQKLIIRAPFSGTVTEKSPFIRTGMTVSGKMPLVTIRSGSRNIITAYLDADEKDRLHGVVSAEFIPAYSPLSSVPVKLERIGDIATATLSDPELSSTYGGPIVAIERKEHNPQPVKPVFKAGFSVETPQETGQTENIYDIKTTGWIRIKGEYYSPLFARVKAVMRLLRNEGI